MLILAPPFTSIKYILYTRIIDFKSILIWLEIQREKGLDFKIFCVWPYETPACFYVMDFMMS